MIYYIYKIQYRYEFLIVEAVIFIQDETIDILFEVLL